MSPSSPPHRHERTLSRGSSISSNQLARRLPLVAEILAAAALIGAPLLLGAVTVPVILLVSALGCASLLCLALSGKTVQGSWLTPLLLAVLAWTAFQLIPLPPGLSTLLAPVNHGLYLAAGVDGWHPLSLDPAATARELAEGLGWVAIFVVLQDRATASRDARKRILVYVGAAAGAVALIGLGHFVAGEKKSLLGLYTFPGPKPFLSTLGNTNNLAGFLGLGGLIALGLAAQTRRQTRRMMWAAIFLSATAGVILSASRGGTMALAAGVLVLPLLGAGSRTRREKKEADSWKSWATVGGGFAMASLLAWWIYAELPRLMREMATVFAFDVAAEDGKLEAYRIAIDAARAHPFFGIGRGAFESSQALYLSKPWHITFTHAENEPLQALAELGLPVGMALIFAFGIGWVALLRRGRLSWAEAGAAAGVFALSLQNLVDFSLNFAAGLSFLAILAFRPARPFRLPALAIASVSAVLVAWSGAAAWQDFQGETGALVAIGADAEASAEDVDAAARAAWSRRPAWYLPAEVAANRALQDDRPRQALPWINELLRLAPTSGKGHLLAGEGFARLGMKQQALGEFRRAASLRVGSIDRVLAFWPEPAAVLAAVPVEADPTLGAIGAVERAGMKPVAIELVARALEREPENEKLLTRLYWLRLSEKEYDEAVALAARLRPLLPDRGMPQAYEARARAAAGQREEARELYLEAIRLERRSHDPLFWFAELELAEKNPGAALQLLDRLPATAGEGSQLQRHWLRARAFRATNSALKARDELRLALGKAPDRKHFRTTLAAVYLDLGELDEAARTLEPLGDDPAGASVAKRLGQLREAEANRLEELQRARILRNPLGGR